ncbi:MAG: methyl-accepting chemotaxis protein [Alphaproteobacteria bacterium]
MTIKQKMLALFSVVSILLFIAQGQLFSQAYNRYKLSLRALASNQVVDDLLNAASLLAMERGLTVAALAANQPSDKEAIQKIIASRGEADKKLIDAFNEAKNAGLVIEEHYTQDIAKATEALKILRQAVDANIVKPKTERDTKLITSWMPGITALIVETQKQRINFGSQSAQDASLSKDTLIRHSVWLMTEYAGRERGLLASAIASGDPISPDTLQQLLSYRGRVEEGWSMLTNIYLTEEERAAFSQSINEAREDYFGSFEKVRQIVYSDAKLGLGYSLTAKDWIDRATQAIAKLSKIKEVSTNSTNNMLHKNRMAANEGRVFYGSSLLISVLAVIIALWVVLRKVISSIKLLSETMNVIATGEFEHNVPYLTQTDEIGSMAKSVEVFRRNGIEKNQLEAQQKQAAILAEKEKKKAQTDLANKFETQVQGIMSTVAAAATELYQTAESMSKTIEISSSKAEHVASSSEEASNNVQTVAAAAEEMNATVREIASQLAKSSIAVKETVHEVNKADSIALLLSDATQKIGEIVDVIQNIAGQINLLALNATIESARAGEAGRGFAVVASEVKNLATQTSESTEQITEHVQSIQAVSKQVIEVLQMVKKSVASVDEYSAAISAAVEEQSATNHDISSNMNRAASGTRKINDDIGEVSKASAEASRAALQTLDAARMVSVEAEKLNQEVYSFLAGVRNG